MKILVIGNPISGRGKGALRMLELAAILRSRGHSVEAYATRFSGDAKEVLFRCGREYDRIALVGGDGTFNEAINGLSKDFQVPLLQVPAGNVNLLARDLSLPKSAEGAANLLEKGALLRADAAVLNGRKFMMVAGAGFDGRVTEEMQKVRKGRITYLNYLLPIAKAFAVPSRCCLEVRVDGCRPVRGAFVLVCNGRNYAGLCELAFEAGVDTGLLDIVVLPSESAAFLTTVLLAARLGRVTALSGVYYLKGKTAVIRSDRPVPVQVDGDFSGRHTELTIRILPGCVSLLVPKQPESPALHCKRLQ